MEHWIWLPEDKYPARQTTKLSCMLPGGADNYTVVLFAKRYDFGKRPVVRARFRVSGDTAFMLFADTHFLFRGPASVGGDFLYNDVLRREFYATEYEMTAEECPDMERGILPLSAIVRMGSVRICEYSRGQGGFMLEGRVFFADGGEEEIFTDESWSARLLPGLVSPYVYDGSAGRGERVSAERKTPPVPTVTAPIPPCEERALPLENEGRIKLTDEKKARKTFTLDRIYACYLDVYAETGGPVKVTVSGSELGGSEWSYDLRFAGDDVYYGMELQSVGELTVDIEKESDVPCEIGVLLLASNFPAPTQAETRTADPELDLVFDVCAHSLKYCRQTHHLDSPRHCEPLACTGDYYVETLMTAFTFGDMRLARFDLHRTAELLRQHDGEMFHTSYSLIWTLMLWDVYLLTGDIGLLSRNAGALGLRLRRFAGYVGGNGLIETPPNYMFVDWLCPDGINLHHPPKALGQTCMCMFYYGALTAAAKIYEALGDGAAAFDARNKANMLRRAVTENLWDGERGLFFEGLNTPTDESLIGQWMPKNVEKRYYRKHANILAAYFGFFDDETCRAILRRIIPDETLGEVQPYFMHFLLDAVYRRGLRGEFTLKLLEQWKEPVAACPKGLPEGFFKPDPGYSFDHSHAWAGTPAYALGLAISGLKSREPGFGKISLSPSSLGLAWASTQIPTPFGTIKVFVNEYGEALVDVPEGITQV